MKVIYEPHPISPARKARLQAQGYKIIDAVFAPPGTPLHQKMDVEAEEEAPAEPEADIVEAVEEVVEVEAEKVERNAGSRKRGRPRKD